MTGTDHLSAQAANLFQELSWPSPDDEAWRRTNLTRLLPKRFLDETAATPVGRKENLEKDTPTPQLPENYAARIITEAGRPVAMAISPEAAAAGLAVSWAEPGELPSKMQAMGRDELNESTDRVAVWHWRDLPGALVLSIPEGKRISTPVVIEERLTAGENEKLLFIAPHLHVEAGDGAELSIVWSLEGTPALESEVKPVVNACITSLSGVNAAARVMLRQSLGGSVVFFCSALLQADRDGRVDFFESHLGGALVKTSARVILAGEGAEGRLKGLYAAGKGQHIDIGSLQEHRCPQTTSNALYKGAVRPGGRTVFQGLIEVHPDAEKTDAYLTNKNLILGDGGRADSIPKLNILTDDVKCSHGSTTGKLDEGQLFYLQSRGYSPSEAAREIAWGFLAEVFDGAPEALAEMLAQDVRGALWDAG